MVALLVMSLPSSTMRTLDVSMAEVASAKLALMLRLVSPVLAPEEGARLEMVGGVVSLGQELPIKAIKA